MANLYVTGNGRVIPEAATDQPGSPLRLRTVSRYTDGTPIDRAQLCLAIGDWAGRTSSPEYAAAIARAANQVRDLERRGHTLIEDPCSADEWPIAARLGAPSYQPMVYAVLVEGLPVGMAIDEALPADTPATKRRNVRRRLQRLLAELGWAVA